MIATPSGPSPKTASPAPAVPQVQRNGEALAAIRMAVRGFRLLWTASIAVPLLIFAAAAAWSWQNVEAEAQARLARTVDMLHEHALRAFETQETVLEAVDQRVRDMTWDEIASSWEVHRFLAAVNKRAVPSGGIVLVGPDDRIASSSFSYPADPLDLSDRDFLRVHRSGQTGTHIGEVIVARPQDTIVFSVSRPRLDLTGGYDGAIVSSVRPDYFTDFYRSVTEAPGDVVTLVRADGSILARSPPPADLSAYRSNPDSTLAYAVRSFEDQGFVTARSRVDGIERLYAYKRVGHYPVYVTYGLSQSVMRDAWLRQLAVSGAVCAIAAALLMVLTSEAQTAVAREQFAFASARAEAERRADAEGRLYHAQKVEALGQIVGGVAHDFNNIVMAVKAGAGRMVRRAENPDEVRRVAGLVSDAAERGARLTARMLAFARREETRTETVDVRGSLENVRELLGNTLGSGFRVEVDCAGDLPPALADRAEFETVIVNLVINARDAMPGGGVVTITAAQDDIEAPDEEDIASALPSGRFVRIAVSDTGTGMDAATLERAGEAFFTTKGPGKGTGLGLATARGFAEHAGGALRIDSELGRGTRVTLWLATERRESER